ncbi:hypothetical protein ACU8KH_03851 [Lachancea thermotolerans]
MDLFGDLQLDQPQKRGLLNVSCSFRSMSQEGRSRTTRDIHKKKETSGSGRVNRYSIVEKTLLSLCSELIKKKMTRAVTRE